MIIHVVQMGETLWTISRIYQVSYLEIAEINELPDPNRLVPGLALLIPTEQGSNNFMSSASLGNIEVNGYLVRMQSNAVLNVGAGLTYLSPFSYHTEEDGNLVPLNDAAVLAAAETTGAAPLMVITNFFEDGFSSDLAHALLSSPEVQNQLIRNVLTIMDEKGYYGLNIDFEYVYPSDRELYNDFLIRVTDQLRPRGYLTSSALAPKTSANQPGLLYEAHDYRAHGEILDFVVLMTYEWGWSGGPPMAVAPLHQVRAVLNYALTEMPPERILMGMPLYGYDWTLPYVAGGPPARVLSPQEAVRLALTYYAPIQYDINAQAPFFYYVDSQQRSHVVWFEDARSVQAKFNLVKELNLRGISYWELSNSFPQNWLLLQENFRIKKLR
ncbi:glycosyl hydrolase family 18 protein [Dehalobacterium formicoaceticum]|uniref:glycosyl hydrolase family 18 protein n=1 Tax=Dehalobacterium formicoaceticum TaxID=51515 RepID=UPI000B7F34D6|nr:glycosyl hydrolase family 18 protein [Dehalobacterium formicoaceticum]